MPTRPARSHHRAGRLVPLATAALLALLAACAPHPTPSATVTATPSSTPSPALPAPAPSPTQPPDMSRDDETGAIAAVDYFLALYTYTESTQDTAPWEALSHPSCTFCTSVVDDVASQRAQGRVMRAQPMTVTERSVKTLAAVAFEITVQVTKAPDELWSTDGQQLDAGSDIGGTLDVIVIYQVDRWVVRAVSTSQPVTR